MLYKNQSDETLVMLTLAGEQSAYEVLVVRYQRAVIASAASITKNGFMAEDAAQDAFVTAWMKLDSLKDPQKFASWVCRIAKNCALNILTRYRSFIPIETVENQNVAENQTEDLAEFYALAEEKEELHQSIGKLPEKVKQIIYLHYFEGLSVAEIADRMRTSVGTVKWQLHDGRKRIRKELCAMNEKYNDTLVEKVMKKVEELKLWQFKNDKSGFEVIYRDVLREVEELPECKDKYHALADVLMRGWWWLPGKKNDELFARIREAAELGKNDEVMEFIVTREDSQVPYGEARITFMREKQIPRLEKAGFVKALAREWFWLGYYLLRGGKLEEGYAAYNKVEEILAKGNVFRDIIPYAKKMEEELATRYKDTTKERYLVGTNLEEYRIIGGAPHYFSGQWVRQGYLGSIDRDSTRVFSNASCCDGCFFADISLGETHIGSDGASLTFVSDSESVDTPAGKFDNCRLWEVRRWTDAQKIVSRTFYKDGVGIVRQEHITDGTTAVRSLKAYEIKGGDGLLPLFGGNTWEYDSAYAPEAVESELKITVSFADDKLALVSYWENTERLAYDESSWLDAVQEITNDYCYEDKNGREYLRDVNPAVERAEALAKTPMEKAYTKAAASVIRRIMITDPKLNPDYKATGHWNFFNRTYIRKKFDSLYLTDYNDRWSFEWKNTGAMGAAEDPILYNDIFGILQDATDCIWSDEWQVGVGKTVEYCLWGDEYVKTQITCSDSGSITTKAGTFDNCIKLELDISGLSGGLSYRGGKKTYYFADGIGIVRTENEYCGGAKTAVYELTSYKGTGEGFMPIADGFLRRYDALDLTDGFVGATEYTYVADEDGDIVVFADRTGIREVPSPITQYSAIQGEVIEDQLWAEGKWKESHMKYGANNFHLILHLLGRPSRNRNNAKRSIELHSFFMKTIESLGENAEVPTAWYNLYMWCALIKAAASFGDGRKEEGYSSLDTAISYCEKINELKTGDLLDLGNGELFGGAKYEYGKGVIVLSDGSKEPVSYDYDMSNRNAGTLLYAMTSARGWEWFNSVRNEDRFKEYIEKARKLSEK